MDNEEINKINLKSNEDLKNRIKLLSDFFKEHYLLIVIIVYILGTMSLIIRNKMIGIPFQILGIQQYVLIIVYWLIVVLSQFITIIPLLIAGICCDKEMQLSKKSKIVVWTIAILIYILINFLNILILDFVIDLKDKSFWLILFVPVYVIYPFIESLFRNSKLVNKFLSTISSIFVICIIFFIPINLGGYKSILVEYIQYNNPIEENINENTYDYYGITENLYILKQGNIVFLVPQDSGYIKYKTNN